MLTPSQKTQLHKDILEYFVNNQYQKTAETFASEAELSLIDIDPEGNKMLMKWKSIYSLQKKITNLEEKIQSLEEQLSKSSNGKQNVNVKMQDLYIPKIPAKQMKGHKQRVTCVAFHPHFTELASSSEDGTIKIWEIESCETQRTLKGHTNQVYCVNYDENGKYIVSSSSDLTIKLWDLSNDYQCWKTFFGHGHSISYVNFVRGGDFILSCSRDKTLKLWEVSTGYCKRTYFGHEEYIRRFDISADGKTFVSCSDDQSVIVWNYEKQTPVFRFFGHGHAIDCVMIVEGQHSSLLMKADFLKHKFKVEQKMNALKQLESGGVNGIANYIQTFVMTASREKLIKLFVMNTGELLFTFVGHDNWVKDLAMHPKGKYLYSVSDDKTLRVWDLTYGKEKKKIEAHENFITTIKFHPKYAVIATASFDNTIKIWSLK